MPHPPSTPRDVPAPTTVRDVEPHPRARYTAVTVLAGSVAWQLFVVLTPRPARQFMDWQVYQLGGRAVLDGTDLYGFRSAHGGPFTYPPLAGLLFTPFAHVTVTAGGLSMAALTLTALAAVTVLLRRGTPLPTVLLAVAVVIPTDAVGGNIGWGQLNLILAALVLVDVLLPWTPWPRGAAIGLAAAIKLVPALFVIHLVLSGRFRTARNAALTGAGLTAVAWVLLPTASRTYWFDALWQTGRVGPTDSPGNRSVWGLVLRQHLPEPAGHLLLAVVLLTLLVVVMRRAVRATRTGDDLLGVTLVGLLGCLVSPITWSHHVVWMIPAAVLLLRRPAWWSGSVVVLLLLLCTRTVTDRIGVHAVTAQTLLLIGLALALPGSDRPQRSSEISAFTPSAR